MYWKLHQPLMQLKIENQTLTLTIFNFNTFFLGTKTIYEQIEFFSTKCLFTDYEKIFPVRGIYFWKIVPLSPTIKFRRCDIYF